MSPQARHAVGDPGDGLTVCLRWTEVPARGEARSVVHELPAEKQISAERIQDELPRPNGVWITDHAGPAGKKGPHQIGN